MFACKRVDLRRRTELFKGRVLTVLLHGAGAWATLLEGELKALSAGYLSLCRQLLCIGRHEDPCWSAAQILAAVELPEVGVLLMAERLRFLVQLVRSAPDVVWALAKQDAAFLEVQWSALRWMLARVGCTSSLPVPDAGWAE